MTEGAVAAMTAAGLEAIGELCPPTNAFPDVVVVVATTGFSGRAKCCPDMDALTGIGLPQREQKQLSEETAELHLVHMTRFSSCAGRLTRGLFSRLLTAGDDALGLIARA